MPIPVILSGGVGARLWPLSREAHPKPFIKLGDGDSLLQKTYKRAVRVSQSDEIITVTNRDLFFYTKDEYEETGLKDQYNTFLTEPVGRNSTVAIAVAAAYVRDQHGPACSILVMPADHLIDDVSAFQQALHAAEALAEQDQLVTFGITPSSPETGYGYILANGQTVERFVEKPDRDTAERYIAQGQSFWNSGMFCMRAGRFLDELTFFKPDIAEMAMRCMERTQKSVGVGWCQYDLPRELFEQTESISVDYAVFEQSQNVALVPCDMGWSDIGSWTELGGLYPVDAAQNHLSSPVLCEQARNCIVHSTDKRIALLGVENLIVADTADALLVAHSDRAQDIRSIVQTLKAQGDPVYKEFPTVHRPWGTYTVLQEGPGFKLKQIEVKPHGRLSLQSHAHRSEHWVVVRGQARVTNGDQVIDLVSGQSTYIPVTHKHRLENTESEPLILIEVQCGDYLGEDDITRYADSYGRVP